MEFKNVMFSPMADVPIMFAFASGDYYVKAEFNDQDKIQLVKIISYFTIRTKVEKW